MKVRLLPKKTTNPSKKMDLNEGVINVILFRTVILFLLIIAPFLILKTQAAEDNIPQEDILLTKALQKLSQRYEVFFSYDETSIADVEVRYRPESYTDVEHALDQLLTGTALKYKIFDHRYIILYEESKEAISSLKGMVRHLETVIDSQERAVPAHKMLRPVALLQHSIIKQIEPLAYSVSGRVTDQQGEALIGVNIQVKGTNKGTATDFEGNFTLEDIDENSVIVVSYVGYETQEVPVAGKSNMVITLESDSQLLDEVVVTALGIKREEKSLTYSSQTINSDELNEAKEVNVINSLQGKVAGVTITRNATGPGGSSNVVLRGHRSIFGSNQPLYVIDGVPMDNSSRDQGNGGTAGGGRDGGDGIGMINSDNIETMTILKGASAAALYGSQGQNGAIIITTKSGKAGKLSVDYTGNLSFDQPSIMPQLQSEYGQGSGGVFAPGSEASWGPKIAGQPVTLWNGNEVNMQAYPDRIKNFYRIGRNLTNSIGISGGSENVRTYFSYGNTQAQGILPNQELNRNNLDLKIDYTISSKLSFTSKLTYIREDVDNKPFTSERLDATSRIYFAPVSIPPNEMKNYEYFDSFGNRKQSYWSPGSLFIGNPYWTLNRQLFHEQKNRFLALFSAKYSFTDWLYLQLRASMDRKEEDTEEKQYEDSYELSGNGNLFELYNGNRRATNLDALLSFKHDFNSNFDLTGYLGASIQETKYKSALMAANGLNKYDFFFMNNARNPTIENEYGRTPQVQSIYGTATLAYNNYLYLDITARNDWSSALPKENQSYFYPSVGLTAILTDMVNLPSWISYGKGRVSMASSGYGGTEYLTDNYYSVAPGGVVNPPSVRSLGNYKPELTTSFEAGLDLRFLLNRLGLDFTYYRSKTKNQLIQIDVPNATLYRRQYINAGLIENSGIELLVNGTPIQTNKFLWNITVNYSKNTNNVIELTDELNTVVLGDDKQVLHTVSEGHRYGEMFMAEWKKDDQGRKLVDSKGVPLLTAKTSYAGNYNPDFMMGISNSFSLSNLSLSFLIDYRKGGIVIGGTQAILDATGNSKESLYGRESGIILDAYTEDGQKNTQSITAETYWQALGNRTPVKDFYAYSATNLRLRELVLSYKLPNTLLSKSGFIKSAKISLVGRNLFFFKRDAPYDPEIATAVSNRGGIEYASLPATRNFGLNLKLSF